MELRLIHSPTIHGRFDVACVTRGGHKNRRHRFLRGCRPLQLTDRDVIMSVVRLPVDQEQALLFRLVENGSETYRN